MSTFFTSIPPIELKCNDTLIQLDKLPYEVTCSSNILTRRCVLNYGDNATVLFTTIGDGKTNSIRIVIHAKNCKSLAISVEKVKNVLSKETLLLLDAEPFILVFPVKAICYFENEIGPYGITERGLTYTIDEKFVTFLMETPVEAVCDVNVFLVDRTSVNYLISEYFKRLYGGYVDDGLIWALVKTGRVKGSELPEFIRENQAYYWPRGDIYRSSLYTWYSYGDSASFLAYLELLEQIVDQMNEYGGLLIPYITAARMRNIYGAPQQLYAFEALYRGYQILGKKGLEKNALRALECFLVQPPKCLGYYEVSDGIWFRWGSYHYLSTEPDKKENLLVLNTHLMGVVGFAEAYVLTGETKYREFADRGVKALMSLINDLKDSSGYFHYGLFTKLAFGKLEQLLRPDLLSYHVLSSELVTRAGRLLGEPGLVKLGEEGCLYGFKQFKKGRSDIGLALLKCLVECYKATKNPEYIGMIIDVLRHVGGGVSALGYTLDECEPRLPPAVKHSGSGSVLLVLYENGLFKYLVCSSSKGFKLEFHDKKLPSGTEVKVGEVGVEGIQGYWRKPESRVIEVGVSSYLIVEVSVS